MKTTRSLAVAAVAALALSLTACGSDDDEPAAAPSAEVTPGDDASADVSQDDDRDDRDDDDLTGTTRERAIKAALAETGGGRVTDAERSDDRTHAYEVDVDLENGEDVTVELDEDFRVVRVDD